MIASVGVMNNHENGGGKSPSDDFLDITFGDDNDMSEEMNMDMNDNGANGSKANANNTNNKTGFSDVYYKDIDISELSLTNDDEINNDNSKHHSAKMVEAAQDESVIFESSSRCDDDGNDDFKIAASSPSQDGKGEVQKQETEVPSSSSSRNDNGSDGGSSSRNDGKLPPPLSPSMTTNSNRKKVAVVNKNPSPSSSVSSATGSPRKIRNKIRNFLSMASPKTKKKGTIQLLQKGMDVSNGAAAAPPSQSPSSTSTTKKKNKVKQPKPGNLWEELLVEEFQIQQKKKVDKEKQKKLQEDEFIKGISRKKEDSSCSMTSSHKESVNLWLSMYSYEEGDDDDNDNQHDVGQKVVEQNHFDKKCKDIDGTGNTANITTSSSGTKKLNIISKLKPSSISKSTSVATTGSSSNSSKENKHGRKAKKNDPYRHFHKATLAAIKVKEEYDNNARKAIVVPRPPVAATAASISRSSENDIMGRSEYHDDNNHSVEAVAAPAPPVSTSNSGSISISNSSRSSRSCSYSSVTMDDHRKRQEQPMPKPRGIASTATAGLVTSGREFGNIGEVRNKVNYPQQQQSPKTKKKKKQQKSVAFFERVRALNTMHRNDYTNEEFTSIWYNQDEISSMYQEALTTFNVFKMMMMSNSNANSLMMGSNPMMMNNNTTASHRNAMMAASRNSTTPNLSTMICYRGLEYMSNDGTARRAAIRKMACQAVLNEQERLRVARNDDSISTNDPVDVLSLAYIKCCQRPSMAANMLGSLDATEAMNIYDQTDHELNMLLAASRRENFNDSVSTLGASLPSMMYNPTQSQPSAMGRNPFQSGRDEEDPVEIARIINGLLAHMQL